MPKSFHGGRCWPRSSFLYDLPITGVPAPATLAIPLWGGGAAAVREKDAVAAHTVVGYAPDGLPVYTPLAGSVTAVADLAQLAVRPQRHNIPRLTVHLAVAGRQAEPGPAFPPAPRYWELTRAEIAQRLFSAGVADLRGRQLPGTIVFDGLDPEPPLSCNLRLLTERPEELITGMRIAIQLHGASRARLAIPAGHRRLESRLRSLLTSSVNLHVAAVPNRYPARHPSLLPALAGLPAGSAIYGMEAALRIKQAVADGRPLTAKLATLRDERSGLRRNAELPLGISAADALVLDRREHDGCTLVLGGMLSGTAVHYAGVPLGRGADGVLLLDAGPARHRAACDNCGRCLAVCPARLDPAGIFRHERDLPGGAAELRPDACLDCGLCSHACPAGLDLCQQARIAARSAAGAA